MIGKTVGVYKILGPLGRGGMGVVYKAQDITLGRFAALKFLPEEMAATPQTVARFIREARAAASLNHPNIVTIYGTGQHESGYYFAMEYVEGQSLGAMMKAHGRLEERQVVEVMRQTAAALMELHAHQIIHRDIKPDNIMVDRTGRVRVMDFGLAWAGAEHTRLTSTGTTMGTPQYMSPEQWMDSRVDERSDVYSLGVVFFELLAGQAPFVANTPVALMRKIVEGPTPALKDSGVSVSGGVAEIVERMIAKKPEDRFQSAAELRQKLDHYLEQLAQASRGAAGFLPPGADIMLERFEHEAQEIKRETQQRISRTMETRQVQQQAEVTASRNYGWIAGGAVALVAVCAMAIGWMVWPAAHGKGNPAEFNSPLFPREQFVWIEPGSFEMGSPENELGRKEDEAPHTVTLSHGFWMGKYEVTQAQWKVLMDSNPAFFPGDDRPVETVSWNDINRFIEILNERDGTDFRLPTEAEWEYACRGGSTGPYSSGGDPASLDSYAWCQDNGGQETHPVGKKAPNAWGLYDMHGNVTEWCQDWAAPYENGPVTDPAGPDSGTEKIGRGGSFAVPPERCRSANRSKANPANSGADLGFRICR